MAARNREFAESARRKRAISGAGQSNAADLGENLGRLRPAGFAIRGFGDGGNSHCHNGSGQRDGSISAGGQCCRCAARIAVFQSADVA